jgi:hypothetical protein
MAKLQHIEKKLDANTGELVTLTKTFAVKSVNKEEFYITFLSGLNALCELSRPSDIKVLALMCSKAKFNTGVVNMSAGDRKEIMEKLGGISTQAFSNSISRLKKAGLISGDRGDYELNPHCFWKGTTDERNKLLKDKRMDLLVKFKLDGSKA